jgi:hypothetical protein
MHRSGTSALARTLNLLGVDLGENFYQGPVNPRGYWEHAELMALNDEILSSLLGFWTSPEPLPPGWITQNGIVSRQNQIREILKRDFERSPLWGFKDPRLCVLLPLYLPLFDELGCDPLFVHCIRNPVDVALSLQKRDQSEAEHSLVLWLRYTTEAFFHSYPYSCTYLAFENLLEDWRSTMRTAASQLQIEWPNSIENVEGEIEAYLEPSLRNFSSESEPLEGSGEIFEWITESYALLQKLCSQDIGQNQAKRLFEVLHELDAAFKKSG